MAKKIFITGVSGFIGFHLASFLKHRGDKVYGIDSFNSYYSLFLKKKRAEELKKLGVTVQEGDVNHYPLEELIAKNEVTHIVHLAAQAGVRYSLKDPHAYLKANLEGFLNILELCRQYPHIKLIYASSSSVYGNNSKIPFSIADTTDQQASFYGVTKKTNELMAKNYHDLFGVAVTGLRFFTVYGPWGRPDMAYYSFTKAIHENLSIDIYDQGNMWRDFTYIDDIVEGIAAAIDLGANHEIFNLGNNQPIQVKRLVELLEQLSGKEAIKRYLPKPPGDVPITYADISYSQDKLGFTPKTSIERGLSHFMKWYKEYSYLA